MDIKFGCCYCDKEINDNDGVAVIIQSLTEEDTWQQWWAHGKCAFKNMESKYRYLREEFERFEIESTKERP